MKRRWLTCAHSPALPLWGSLLISLLSGSTAWAQIEVDRSLGTSFFEDVTPQSRSRIEIVGGALQGRNLFHSFQRFNVALGEQVYFSNPSGVEHILARVTGNSTSQILGTLGVAGPANLFILNPNGILFGPNAQLDIQGSFSASTAHHIHFADGSRFSSIPSDAALLTVSAPLGLQLDQSPVGDLTNQANLNIAPRQTLTLLGSTLSNQGKLQASAGQIQLLGNQVEIADPSFEGISGNSSLEVMANESISLIKASDNTLDFASGSGLLNFVADADGDGVGSFVMDVRDTLRTFGRDLSIAGASLEIGGIDTSASPLNEAGDSLATVQAIAPSPTQTLNTISGQLTDPADIDLYQINISGDESFSASTVDQSLVNTQLFLFDANGQGILANDNDVTCGCEQSALRASQPLAPGTYYLGITTYGTEPVSQAGAIFPNGFETLDFFALETPTGAGGGLPLQDWMRQPVGDVGGYGIRLTGVSGALNEVLETPVLSSGSLELTATAGDLNAGKLTTAGPASGGEIRLNAANGNLQLRDTVNALGGQGNGGDIAIQTGGNLTFQPDVFLFTDGQLAGDLTIQAGGAIRLENGLLSLRSTGGTSDQLGGGFDIQGRSLSLLDGSQILAEADGAASLRDSRVIVQDSVFLGGIGSVNLFSPFALLVTQVGTPGTGNGGNFTIEAGQKIETTDASFLGTRSFGRGNAGDLSLLADEVIVRGALAVDQAFLFEGSESVFESELGTEAELESEEVLLQGGLNGNLSRPFELNEANAGNMLIRARRLLVQGGGEVSSGTHSLGDGGNMTIIADEVIVTGQTIGEASELGTETVPEFLGARPPEGNAGNLLIETDRLQVTDGGQISTATFALGGNAGRLKINAREIELGGGFVKADGEIKTGSILSEVLSAAEEGVQGNTAQAFGGAGGIVDITTDQLTIRDGGRISTSTNGNGPAGDLFLRANTVDISGEFIPNGDVSQVVTSGVFASSSVDGQAAGNLSVAAGQMQLRDRAALAATTRGDRGNITVTGGTLLLSNNSQVTTNAGGDSTGGNITLDLDNLIATPELGNNDITANAENGSGGQIRIRTRSPILGFQAVAGETFQVNGQTPGDRPTNDITAFSQFNPSIDNGTVTIEPPDVDPASGLEALPDTVIDPSNQIIAGCPLPVANRFVISRQGGLAPDPRRGLRRSLVLRDLRLSSSAGAAEASAAARAIARPANRLSRTTPQPILTEAQAWYRSQNGEVTLVATAPQYSSQQLSQIASASTFATRCQRGADQ